MSKIGAIQSAGLQKAKDLVSSLNLNDQVSFLGKRANVYQLTNLADLNILSANHEGLSGNDLESMASDNFVISSNIVGLNDFIPNKIV